MAGWIWGPVLCLLLLSISMQLRRLDKHIADRCMRPDASWKEGELSLEAWLQELDARGTEILSKLTQERREVEALAFRLNQDHSGEIHGWEDVQDKVSSMAERGVPLATIAQSLGLGQGEVQLLLRTHKTGHHHEIHP